MKLFDAADERPGGAPTSRPIAKLPGKRLLIEAALDEPGRQDGPQLGSDENQLIVDAVVDGFDAEAVACDPERLLTNIEQAQAEHSSQCLDRRLAPLVPGMQDRFRVGAGMPVMELKLRLILGDGCRSRR